MSRLEDEGYVEALADEVVADMQERREHRERVERAINNVRGFAGAGEVRRAMQALLRFIHD